LRVPVLVADDLVQNGERVGHPVVEDGLQVGAGIGEVRLPRVAGGGNGRAAREQRWQQPDLKPVPLSGQKGTDLLADSAEDRAQGTSAEQAAQGTSAEQAAQGTSAEQAAQNPAAATTAEDRAQATENRIRGRGDARGGRARRAGCVGDLCVEVRRRPAVQQIRKFVVKRRRLGAQSLKLLTVQAE
jgi:hypothetical protein